LGTPVGAQCEDACLVRLYRRREAFEFWAQLVRLPASMGLKARCSQKKENCQFGDDLHLLPNTQVKPRRVVEHSTWQAVPAMCCAERSGFGLNALLGGSRDNRLIEKHMLLENLLHQQLGSSKLLLGTNQETELT